MAQKIGQLDVLQCLDARVTRLLRRVGEAIQEIKHMLSLKEMIDYPSMHHAFGFNHHTSFEFWRVPLDLLSSHGGAPSI